MNTEHDGSEYIVSPIQLATETFAGIISRRGSIEEVNAAATEINSLIKQHYTSGFVQEVINEIRINTIKPFWNDLDLYWTNAALNMPIPYASVARPPVPEWIQEEISRRNLSDLRDYEACVLDIRPVSDRYSDQQFYNMKRKYYKDHPICYPIIVWSLDLLEKESSISSDPVIHDRLQPIAEYIRLYTMWLVNEQARYYASLTPEQKAILEQIEAQEAGGDEPRWYAVGINRTRWQLLKEWEVGKSKGYKYRRLS